MKIWYFVERNEQRNSLSGKEVARSGSDSGSKIGYNGEVLAGASRKGGAVKAGEYRGKFTCREMEEKSCSMVTSELESVLLQRHARLEVA